MLYLFISMHKHDLKVFLYIVLKMFYFLLKKKLGIFVDKDKTESVWYGSSLVCSEAILTCQVWYLANSSLLWSINLLQYMISAMSKKLRSQNHPWTELTRRPSTPALPMGVKMANNSFCKFISSIRVNSKK